MNYIDRMRFVSELYKDKYLTRDVAEEIICGYQVKLAEINSTHKDVLKVRAKHYREQRKSRWK